jgi:propanol-preferring alcohol dehydrogenase
MTQEGGTMLAAVVRQPKPIDENPIAIERIAIPQPKDGEALLKVLACGVCHTDLHVSEGDLPPLNPWIVPGHQIVAEVVSSSSEEIPRGARVGVCWLGGTDGTCRFCLSDRENLCDHPVFTGYTRNGGYAEFVTARSEFLLPLPGDMKDVEIAPLLCAGVIGYRSLRVAEAKPRQAVGLFGFGASAQLLMKLLKSWECRVYVSTREAVHQQLARDMGADWVGGGYDVPPEGLDCAVTFAPSGDVVVAALKSLVKGGIVAINAIHLDRIPEFDYDSLLWGERQIRSVANVTRKDAREFLALASELGIRPEVDVFSLQDAALALKNIRHDHFSRPAVIVPSMRMV